MAHWHDVANNLVRGHRRRLTFDGVWRVAAGGSVTPRPSSTYASRLAIQRRASASG